jgi:hypothetical protein
VLEVVSEFTYDLHQTRMFCSVEGETKGLLRMLLWKANGNSRFRNTVWVNENYGNNTDLKSLAGAENGDDPKNY